MRFGKFNKRAGIIKTAVLMSTVLLLSACAQPGLKEAEGTAVPETNSSEETESLYHENEFGFVDESMDVSGGIPENAEGRLFIIRERGYLTVATEPYYSPQEFIDPSLEGEEQYVGADMELARLIAERMGVELRIVPLDFSDALASVANGTNDLIISGVSFTPARAGILEMSKGYHFTDETANVGILIREEDRDRIRSEEDLAGKNLAAQSGSVQESLLAEHVMNYRQFRRFNTMSEIYTALEKGEVDAAAADIETASIYISNNPGCGLTFIEGIGYSLEEQYWGDRIAGPKDELMLMYFVNGVIDEVVKDGTYEAWFDEYTDYAARLGV
jgi:polar amino acid transport system substrate-binding protein